MHGQQNIKIHSEKLTNITRCGAKCHRPGD